MDKPKSSVKKQPKEFSGVNIFIYIILGLSICQTIIIIFLAHNIYFIIPDKINQTKYVVNNKIDLINADLENKITMLSDNLLEIQTDLGKQISAINAKTSADFSGIIQNSVESVVSVRTDIAQGTGFIITPDGYVVTNAHVLSGARYAEAITSQQEIKSMQLIGYDLNMDIALLKLNGEYSYLEFRDSKDVRVGEKVIAIGNPLGFSFSVSEGIISALNREGSNGINAYVQTDASLNPGNSGGPLIGTDGKVIGINNFKAKAESIGFALESDYIKETVNDISLKNMNRTILT